MAIRTSLTAAHPADALLDRGLILPDPAQVWVDRTVDLDRMQAGAVLCPGARLSGASTFVGSGAVIGSEGPATAVDCAIDAEVEFCSGYAEGAVLFRGSRLGGAAHVRPATILEEGATTAHAVGLKQSLLMSYVTFGSLINACDLLVAGGTSKDDHSEVGSGFIHFNFTPWGERGDKATPSLVGNVHEGVFLQRGRIFLGGMSGLVGPGSVGFGSMTVAGQVIRRKVGAARLFGAAPLAVDREMPGAGLAAVHRAKLRANAEYVGQLCALRTWYVDVRLARRAMHAGKGEVHVEVLEAGVRALDAMVRERLVRLVQYWPRNDLAIDRFVGDLGATPNEAPDIAGLDHSPDLPHLDWVRSLDDDAVTRGVAWLRSIADAAATRVESHFADSR